MPELPEVETIRRGLEARLVGRRVTAVAHGPHEVVRAGPTQRRVYARPSDAAMLVGDAVAAVHRHGKQLAVEGVGGGAVWVHLGMSGQLRFAADAAAEPAPPHTHADWSLGGGAALRFVDPRRFGGLAVHASMADLRATRFAAAGPDALAATPVRLHRSLVRTRRPLKAALLDQAVLAGLGNIYADEACFAAQISPHRPADAVTSKETDRLVRCIRRILKRAIDLGGSTLRDHADAFGNAGSAQDHHAAYGCGGKPCRRCGEPLEKSLVAQRTTVHCGRCQL